MTRSHLLRHAVLLAGGALVIGLTAGCQGNFTASGNVTDPTGSSASSAGGSAGSSGSTGSNSSSGSGSGAGSTGSSGGSGGSGGSSAGRVPECKASTLKLSEGQGEGGGAGSAYPAIQFTNVGKSECVLTGWPGVSFVGGSDGHQIGAPATRSGTIGAGVVLQAGQMASAVVQVADTGNFPANTCQPTAARGFRVYAPDDTASMFLPFSGGDASECGSTADGQLSVQTIKAGPGSD